PTATASSAMLGQGGMATVYLAHDIRHERDVAVKALGALARRAPVRLLDGSAGSDAAGTAERSAPSHVPIRP
ncbi:MAG: hypothetical protein ABI939_12730, partial [Anaerolineaceae bacterium]